MEEVVWAPKKYQPGNGSVLFIYHIKYDLTI